MQKNVLELFHCMLPTGKLSLDLNYFSVPKSYARMDSDKFLDQSKAFDRKWYFEYNGRQDLTRDDFWEIWLQNHDPKHWEYLQKMKAYNEDQARKENDGPSPPPSDGEMEMPVNEDSDNEDDDFEVTSNQV